MKRAVLLIFLSVTIQTTILAVPQHSDDEDGVVTWQRLWYELMNVEDDDSDVETIEDYYDMLEQLADHPLDLNRATREELEQLPFLSEQQVMDFIEYRDKYGPLRSAGELRMIRSMDYQQLSLLPFFTFVGDSVETTHFPRLESVARHGRHELLASVDIPFYTRKGFRNGYLGERYRHWMRYEFSYGRYVRFGLLGSQDAGEPFFAGNNRMRYDYYSYYLQLQQLGRVENAVVGKYKATAGMGLVLGSSMSLGKLTLLENLGRVPQNVRPHASRSESDYFRGAAVTLKLLSALKFTLFGSHRTIDATLNKDGTARTLNTSGYHRTPTEMNRKANTRQTDAGAMLAFHTGRLHVGANVAYTHFDPQLQPQNGQLYRRFFAEGSNFMNASMTYRYMHHRFVFNGETAIDGNGAVATIHSLSVQPSSTWSIVALHRFYSMRYTTIHGHAFGEGNRVQNESGFFIGGTWNPFGWLQLKGYADFVQFPFARYRVSRPSTANDYLGEAVVKLSRSWMMKGRYRLRLRQLDNTKKTALRRHNEHRLRLALTYNSEEWTATTQADGVRAVNNDIAHGWMLSENVSWKYRWWQISAVAGLFRTDSYDARIYVYERQLPHTFASPMFYGYGLRLALVARASIGRHIQADAKLGYTHYNDREIIGSGLQQIDSPTKTDLSLQMRWRF